jgi:hypothetical protein
LGSRLFCISPIELQAIGPAASGRLKMPPRPSRSAGEVLPVVGLRDVPALQAATAIFDTCLLTYKCFMTNGVLQWQMEPNCIRGHFGDGVTQRC